MKSCNHIAKGGSLTTMVKTSARRYLTMINKVWSLSLVQNGISKRASILYVYSFVAIRTLFFANIFFLSMINFHEMKCTLIPIIWHISCSINTNDYLLLSVCELGRSISGYAYHTLKRDKKNVRHKPSSEYPWYLQLSCLCFGDLAFDKEILSCAKVIFSTSSVI